MDEQLIELVRSHEELYNYADKRYSNNDHRQKLWREVAAQLGESPEYCKRRWESLRAQFRKVCRSRQAKLGEAAKLKKNWRFDAELAFLLPFMNDKKRPASLNDISGDDDDLGTDESINDEKSDASSSQNAYPIYSEATNSSGTPTVLERQRRQRVKIEENSDDDFEITQSTVMKHVNDEQKTQHQHSEKDALDYFFEAIKSTINTFSPIDKHLAKVQIFNIVSDIEAKYLCVEDNL